MHSLRQLTLNLLVIILWSFYVDVGITTAQPTISDDPTTGVATIIKGADAELEEYKVAPSSSAINREQGSPLSTLDWGVIAIYAGGMIAVGKYYARRVNNMEDYLLGGRDMRPWAVGLSLFATLVSSISFLAMPGEMIKHGPMIFSDCAAFPLIAFVVGWLIIPRFMKLKVTSANEILEERLGVYIRTLGAALFLGLRLLWMAIILFATSSKVLVPLLGWDPSMTPLLCAVMGVITVIYTAEGGIQAVVITDVIQSMILLGGALLAIVLITVDLGGVGNWWPNEWVTTWDPPKLWFDPDARVTIATAAFAGFSWYLCTAASDQMIIQRYLTTRDIKSARRMYNISMVANAVVVALLGCLGMALLAWFTVHPELLGHGMTISENADQLLPRYIVVSMPSGAKGALLAAILAAAMSSLSSGINSTCTVITVDLVDRFPRSNKPRMNQVRRAKYISWGIGVIVVLLSLAANLVPGNLFEVTSRVCNLLVGPLFVLFFMAMFVPWATPAGALVGALASAGVAVSISFFQIFGLSFLWIIPGSVFVGIGLGVVISAAPNSKD